MKGGAVDMTFLNRRFLMPGGHTFRVVALDGDHAITGRRGEPSQRVALDALAEAVAAGAVLDVTDGRPCPSCGGTMERDGNCRVEWDAPRMINGYYSRTDVERKVAHRAVWLCSGCEHVEEEK